MNASWDGGDDEAIDEGEVRASWDLANGGERHSVAGGWWAASAGIPRCTTLDVLGWVAALGFLTCADLAVGGQIRECRERKRRVAGWARDDEHGGKREDCIGIKGLEIVSKHS